MILCLNSRPWEGKKLLRQSLCFRRLQRQLWPLVSLCLRTWCDVTLQNGADDQSLWWQQGILSGSSSNQGLQRAAALPSTWAAAPCHWTRRLIFTRNTDGRDKKLLSPHCHLGQIGWMTSGFFFFLDVIILFFANSTAGGFLVREGGLDGDTLTGTTQTLVLLCSSRSYPTG